MQGIAPKSGGAVWRLIGSAEAREARKPEKQHRMAQGPIRAHGTITLAPLLDGHGRWASASLSCTSHPSTAASAISWSKVVLLPPRQSMAAIFAGREALVCACKQ